jgi:putative ABC transport system permease protein
MHEPWLQYLSIKTKSQDLPATIDYIKSVWNRYAEQRAFDYSFLDSDFNSLYKREERFAEIVSYSSGLAIFIACLGLLGLASFIVEQKRKEIGIRKVLGASVSDVVGTLSKQFLKLVFYANIIAVPAAYYFMTNWLQDFAYRINISWWIFVLSGGMALLIALITVSSQTIKAALSNPVKSIRYE